MKTINVLIVVDVMGALTTDDLQSNVYLIDTNKFMGSYEEGQSELTTKCYNTQHIKWRVTSISPDNDAVSIDGFTGTIEQSRICTPEKHSDLTDPYWEGIVETKGDTGCYQYSCVLNIEGKKMSFDPFIEVVPPGNSLQQN
ncbi:hypothetical protein EYV94_08120 [Puteibacter caeruleilacunae]|nr:hypothetical protein EYV94_08120 [Puteibacter caeruleilacunae]